MTKFGGNRSGHVEAISLGSVARRRKKKKKKKKKKKETSKIQYPAGYSGRVTRDICVCKQTLVHRRIFYDERDCFCRC